MAARYPAPTKTWHVTAQPSTLPSRPELSAQGKTVVITGGGTGIGAATARAFAEAGASRIVLFGRRAQPLLDTKADIERTFPHVEVRAESVDVTQKEAVDAGFEKTMGNHKVDILISNAAVMGPREGLKDVDPDQFMEHLDSNVKMALYLSQAFLRFAAENAVVVDVSSLLAYMSLSGLGSCYSVSKLAVYRMWDSLAIGNPHIFVFHLQPGFVDTAMSSVGGSSANHESLPACFMLWLASTEARFLRNKFVWSNWDVDELKQRAAEIEGSAELSITVNGWPFGDIAQG